MGEDIVRARALSSCANTSKLRACRTASTRWAFRSSASAAPPATATPVRWLPVWKTRSSRAASRAWPCCRETATSRAAFIRCCVRPISPRRRSSSPMRWWVRCCATSPATPLGVGADGRKIMLSDVWPSDPEVAELSCVISAEKYRSVYAGRPLGHAGWQGIEGPTGTLYPWPAGSTFLGPLPREELDARWRIGRFASMASGAGDVRRQRHHRSPLAQWRHPAGQSRPPTISRRGASSRTISATTRRGAETTRSPSAARSPMPIW